MINAKSPFTELLIVSDRPAFQAEVHQAAVGAEGIGIGSVEGGPRPGSLAACLAALGSRKGAILLIDGLQDPAAALLLCQALFDRQPSARVFLAGGGADPNLILRALRSGASEFLPVPLERRTLLEAIQRLWRRAAPEGSEPLRRRGRVFPFLGAKGGCGTTTLASNLAVVLALRGHSTILVDLDLSAGDVSLMLNLNPSFTVTDVVQNAHRLDRDLLSGMVTKHVSGLEVLASGEDPERSRDLDPAKIGQILSFLRDQFECVVVNTRGADDPAGQAALNHADLVHLVACLDFLSMRRAQWVLRRLSQGGLSREMIRLVVNRYDRSPYITLEEAEKVLDLKVAWTVPLDLKTAQEALNDGVALVTRNRNGLLGSFAGYAATLVPGGLESAAAPRKKLFGLIPSRPASRPGEGHPASTLMGGSSE